MPFFAFSQGGGVLDPQCNGFAMNDSTANPLPIIHHRDILWLKRIWRVIDLKEVKNKHLRYSTTLISCQANFLTLLIQGIDRREFKAYHPIKGEDFSTEISDVQFNHKIVQQLTMTSVVKYLIKEDWYFDGKRGEMNVRILGICPVVELKDDEGNIKGDQRLFWVYFPHIRNSIIKRYAFESFPNNTIPTFNEVFEKRMFSSYIYKVSNVIDGEINSYALGLDASFESDKMKQHINLIEDDLWDY
ncbi:MAG: gliding motility protein GldN [Flavobacteriales bacterium]|nr:gliding motility protein GldN [Flavobacteriales bacterium]